MCVKHLLTGPGNPMPVHVRTRFSETTCSVLCPLTTMPGGQIPRRCNLCLPPTSLSCHMGSFARLSLLLSPTDGTISVGAAYWRAKWDLPTGDASSNCSHILHCFWSRTSHLRPLRVTAPICRIGRIASPTLWDCAVRPKGGVRAEGAMHSGQRSYPVASLSPQRCSNCAWLSLGIVLTHAGSP